MTSYNSEAPVLDTYHAVVSAYSDFLTVAIHTILYERNIYPQTSFIKARKYNYPVRQSRHPKLCKWITDAVASVEVEMLKVRSLSCVSWIYPDTIVSDLRFTPLEQSQWSVEARSETMHRILFGKCHAAFGTRRFRHIDHYLNESTQQSGAG